MQTVLITGGTGLVGTALTKALTERGYAVIILTRKARPAAGMVSYATWDPEKGIIDPTAISNADFIINLAGANVAGGRWTHKRKAEIVNSRVKSGQLLVEALKRMPNKVGAVISASAIGWYRPDPLIPNPEPFTETHPADNSFLGTTCQQWEAAITPVTDMDMRLIIFRIGIVLSNNGAAYAEFKKPLKFRVAAVLGSGKQVVSWIHIDDLVALFIRAIQNESMNGIYNAVAPNPVSNAALIKSIAAAKGGFHITASAPAPILKALLGEMSIEVLKSTTVSCRKLEAAGYQFLFPHIDTATMHLHKNPSV